MTDYSDEYKDRVLSEFARVHRDIKEGREETNNALRSLGEKIDLLKDGDITTLKVKIAVMDQENKDRARSAGALWGAISALVVGIVVAVIGQLMAHGGR